MIKDTPNWNLLSDITFVTITYNDHVGLIKTCDSLKQFKSEGSKHVIVNGGNPLVKGIVYCDLLIEEPDYGIYDALNKGIKEVKTNYFMLIHSGDELVVGVTDFIRLMKHMISFNLDLLLNDCVIETKAGSRNYKSKNWRPWFLKLGVQPPHPSIIYKKSSLKSISYDISVPTISDFLYLEILFNSNIKFDSSGILFVRMARGGKTTSGLRSYLRVNNEFRIVKGFNKMLLYAILRPCFKIYLMV